MWGLYGKVLAWSVCQIFPVGRTDRETRLVRHLLYGFWFIFFSVYSAVFVFRCCRLPYTAQLSRKATLMFKDVLLFELFHKNISNPLLFLFKSTRKTFPAKNLQVRNWKAYCRQHAFLRTLSATNQIRTYSTYSIYGGGRLHMIMKSKYIALTTSSTYVALVPAS